MDPCTNSAQLSAYHDNELPSAQRFALETHLQSCAACARELEELRRLTRLCQAARNEPRARVNIVKFGDVRRIQSAQWLEKILIGAAAAIMLGCGSWLLVEPQADSANSVSLDAMVLRQSDSRDQANLVIQSYAREYGE